LGSLTSFFHHRDDTRPSGESFNNQMIIILSTCDTIFQTWRADNILIWGNQDWPEDRRHDCWCGFRSVWE